MALQFTTQVATESGLVVDNAYGRVAVTDDFDGSKIRASLAVYVSEAKFEEGADALMLVDVPRYASQAYDRAVDGVDVLDLAHDALIAKLADEGFVATKDL